MRALLTFSVSVFCILLIEGVVLCAENGNRYLVVKTEDGKYERCNQRMRGHDAALDKNKIHICLDGNGWYSVDAIEVVRNKDWFPNNSLLANQVSEVRFFCDPDRLTLPNYGTTLFPIKNEAQNGRKISIKIPCSLDKNEVYAEMNLARYLIEKVMIDPQGSVDQTDIVKAACEANSSSPNCKNLKNKIGEVFSGEAMKSLEAPAVTCGASFNAGLDTVQNLGGKVKSKQTSLLGDLNLRARACENETGGFQSPGFAETTIQIWKTISENLPECGRIQNTEDIAWLKGLVSEKTDDGSGNTTRKRSVQEVALGLRIDAKNADKDKCIAQIKKFRNSLRSDGFEFSEGQAPKYRDKVVVVGDCTKETIADLFLIELDKFQVSALTGIYYGSTNGQLDVQEKDSKSADWSKAAQAIGLDGAYYWWDKEYGVNRIANDRKGYCDLDTLCYVRARYLQYESMKAITDMPHPTNEACIKFKVITADGERPTFKLIPDPTCKAKPEELRQNENGN